jgi:hypothetical protein
MVIPLYLTHDPNDPKHSSSTFCRKQAFSLLKLDMELAGAFTFYLLACALLHEFFWFGSVAA